MHLTKYFGAIDYISILLCNLKSKLFKILNFSLFIILIDFYIPEIILTIIPRFSSPRNSNKLLYLSHLSSFLFLKSFSSFYSNLFNSLLTLSIILSPFNFIETINLETYYNAESKSLFFQDLVGWGFITLGSYSINSSSIVAFSDYTLD